MKPASAIVVVALAAAVTVTPIGVARCQRSTAESAAMLVGKTAEALRGVLGTRVTVTGGGVVCIPRKIAELAVTVQDVVVDTRHDRGRIFGSFPACLEIRGHYTAKAGIDLSRLTGRLDVSRRLLVLRLPRCGLLSLEALGAERKWQDDSFLNRATPADFATALAENIATARQQASRAEVLARADEVLATRLRDALAPLGVGVEVSVVDEVP